MTIILKTFDSFIQFSEILPFYGYLIVNGDDKNIKKITKEFQENRLLENPKCRFSNFKFWL